MLKRILENECPRCGIGHVFSGLMKMNETCSHCGFKFERESGYFYGAVFLHYILLAFAVIPIIAGGFLVHAQAVPIFIAALVEILVFSLPLFRLSRLIWLHMDYKNDPEKESGP
jgi:uncharacterized protein (DUF983 family)